MNLTEAVKKCFKNYANFQGRARRAEYWYWTLFVMVLSMPLYILAMVTANIEIIGKVVAVVYMAFALAVFIPGLAVAVRRLHDLDKSGWWYLLILVPLVGAIVLLIWFCTEGTKGENRFGSDPLGNDLVDAF